MADTTVVPSVLESVVVHAAGAVCRRRARFTLDGSGTQVRVADLPVTMFEHALRAVVADGPAGLRVTDVRAVLDVEVREAPELPSLKREYGELEAKVTAARARRDRLTAGVHETSALRAVPPQSVRGAPPRTASVDSMLALAEFVDRRVAGLQERLTVLQTELDALEHAWTVADRRLREASGALRPEYAQTTCSALLTLDGVRAGEVEVELEYQVPGARWVPVYQLRLDPGMDGGSLVMRASVAQRTGEDWSGVRLGLSTADLDRRTDLPELASLRIGRRQTAPGPAGWREPPSGLDELFGGYDAAAADRGPVAAGGAADTPAYGMAAEVVDEDSMWASAAPAGPPPPPPSMVAYGAPPALVEPGGPPPEPRLRGRAAPVAALRQDPAQGFAAPQPVAPQPAEPGGIAPSDDLLDYAALRLTGPDGPEPERGRLKPVPGAGSDAVVTEFHRRAHSVTRLPLPSHALPVRDSSGSFDYRFDTAAEVDVEADGGWHTVPVCEVPVSLAPEFVTVPAVDETVFGTVRLTNASGHALLAGPADVTVAGEFLTTVPLPTLAPGAHEKVGVGVVESVQVARRTSMTESTAGLGSRTTVLDHTVEVDVANLLGHPIVIEVLERVPTSYDKEVRIEERPADQWSAVTEPRDGQYVHGARVWRLELAAGQKRTLTGGYEIRIPSGKTIVGGNRRG